MKQVQSLLHSFCDAWRGITTTVRTERNFRIEVIVAMGVLIAVSVIPLHAMERIGAWMVVFIVLVAELFNTAIERAVDCATQEYSDVARVAKDAAAGAVLMAGFGALVYGGFLLWRIGGMFLY